MALLCIDESGNTAKTIALGLTAIPDKSIEPLCQLFTLRPTDSPIIQALYHRDPEAGDRKQGEPSKPRDEFKYSDFINAAHTTGLTEYRNFVKDKFAKASGLGIQFYSSLFDRPEDNLKRRGILEIEAQTIMHMWRDKNSLDALSKDLRIVVDNQVFREEMLFQTYERRNKVFTEIFPTSRISGQVHYGGNHNEVIIVERSSKDFKPLQFTDFLVGAYREINTRNVPDMAGSLQPYLRKDCCRDIRGEYQLRKGLRLMR